jgi:hypothetical protein
MMKNQRNMPQRDLELLSAYIDGQLSDRQTRRLLTRLGKEPELARELEELRATVRQLRNLPSPRPSRHLTLTPEMVGQRETSHGYPVLRLATALAGLAFVALVGLEGLLSISGSQMATRAPAVMQEAERATDALTGVEEPMAAAPAEELPTEVVALEVPAEEAEEVPEAFMMEEPAAEEEPAAAEDQVLKVSGTPEATESVGMAETEPSEGRANAIGETEAGEELMDEAEFSGEAPGETPPTPLVGQEESAESRMLSPLRWLQVITGALFILLSVLTITFRKRST